MASAVATRRRPGCRPPFPAINRRATFGSRYAAGAKEENRNHGLQEWGGWPAVRHDGSGLQPFVSFLARFLGRCPRLGWHRAVGPQESACITGFCGWFPGRCPRLGWHGAVGPQESARITRDLDCSPIFRANGAPPSQPGQGPTWLLWGGAGPSLAQG